MNLDSEERTYVPEESFFDGKVVTKTKALGADDFLPIFIFCFVQANIERPSALCKFIYLLAYFDNYFNFGCCFDELTHI